MLTGVVAVAAIGFFVGIDYGVPYRDPRPAAPVGDPVSSAEAVPAVSYRQLREVDIGPNRDWRSDLDRLPRPQADLFSSVLNNAELRHASVQARVERRAFHGAPPTVPHATDQMSDDNCVACHAGSVRIGQQLSPIVPHDDLRSCQQCHVQSDHPLFESGGLAAPTTFLGLESPTVGVRAWPGAPPTVPHATFMRHNCLACHGPTSDLGLRTTHPWRSSCLQCHAPSADLDQHAGAMPWRSMPDGGEPDER